jgi:hypothetical protein
LESTKVHLIYVTIRFLTHEITYNSPTAAFVNFHMAIVESQQAH